MKGYFAAFSYLQFSDSMHELTSWINQHTLKKAAMNIQIPKFKTQIPTQQTNIWIVEYSCSVLLNIFYWVPDSNIWQ